MDPTIDLMLAQALEGPPEAEHAFVLVDAALHGDLQHRAILGVEGVALPVPGVNDKRAKSLMPVLMAWPQDKGMQRWLLPRSIRWAREKHAVTWLRSELPLQALAQHLGACMAGELDDGRKMLLRFADARALPSTAAHLDASQRAALFGPVTHWWYLNRQDELRELPLGSWPAADPAPLPLRLTEAQLAELVDAAEPDIVLQLLTRLSAEALKAMSPSARHAFVVRGIEWARTWGIEASIDLANYCSRELELGSGCHQTPEWANVVRRVKAGELTWSQALNETADSES